MIRLESLTKVYATPQGSVAAVDRVSFEVGDGETCVLLGPSGCGKTTTLRMINRLVTPTSGKVFIAGRDTDAIDPVELRRTIGYVIQQIGLFPNMTVAQNIGVVPRLLKWDATRMRRRAEELLAMLALEPAEFMDRYPNELSGGQAQRVGVARALAADPPVLLMDEPFGAVDPITRQRLQDELLRLQEELRKTIVFVTHDFDEAVKLGDKIAILRAGAEIGHYDTPEQILTNPADGFVRDFVGSGAALKQLTLTRVRDVELHDAAVARIGGDPDEAIRAARSIDREHVIVLDDQDRPQRWMSLDELQDPGSLRAVPRDEQLESVNLASTLNDALDSMLTSSHGVVVVTGRRNAYQGVIRVETIMDAMSDIRGAPDSAATAS